MNWRPWVGGSSYTRSTSWLVVSVCPEFGLLFERSVLSLVIHQLSHPAAKRRAFLIWVQPSSSSGRHMANLALPSPVGDVIPPKEKASVQSKITGRMKYNRSMSTSSGGMGLKSDAEKLQGILCRGHVGWSGVLKRGFGGVRRGMSLVPRMPEGRYRGWSPDGSGD
ncbi:hypothetical protein R1flu_006124 [Riccia fluitans]|uniref:Uncharacterized protein n=1 Tax=Riccia fluitans TaxID=41844 RepID=A0ABD1YW00_9MARC